jgi:DUF4097 and DUF4098 domain-containing protein YvlB
MSSWEFPAEGPITARIKLASGSVAVTAAPTQTVTVSISAPGRGGEDVAHLAVVDYHDGQLTVSGPEHSGLLRKSPGLDVAVTVPEGSALTVDTASADVHCAGELARLNASSASGDIQAERVTGISDVSTASGDVRVDRSGQVRVKSVSGDIQIDAVDGDATGQSVSGDIEISAVRTGEISVKTTSGDITVAVAAGTGVQLDLSTLTGDASSELEPEGQAGTADATVTCRSVSGDVIVRRAA